jgi:hypothetical protein
MLRKLIGYFKILAPEEVTLSGWFVKIYGSACSKDEKTNQPRQTGRSNGNVFIL